VTVRAWVRETAAGRWQVSWATTRNFLTREEAERAAQLAFPPPSRQGREPVEVARFIVQLHEQGMSARLIAALCAEGQLKSVRGGQWTAVKVQRILDRERADAQQDDDEPGALADRP
jgi:hypothetical protein